MDDDAPFSLWDARRESFRFGTPWEDRWMIQRYHAIAIYSRLDRIFIYTAKPPIPVPLTVGCVPVSFLPPENTSAHYDEWPWPNDSHLICRHGPEPMVFRLPMWALPTVAEWEGIVQYLNFTVNLKALTFLAGHLYVELVPDDRIYEANYLPIFVAGKMTFYTRQPEPLWRDFRRPVMDRECDPTQRTEGQLPPQDRTNYLARGCLGPGARLDPGAPLAEPFHEPGPSTAGLLLRHSSGSQRLVGALSKFNVTRDSVYHPVAEGEDIGTVVSAEYWNNMAYMKLNPGIKFSNQPYFDASPPKKLLRYGDLAAGMWFTADTMSTGLISLMLEGLHSRCLVDKSHGFGDWQHDGVYHTVGPASGPVAEGAAGAPIVCDDPAGGGGVAGFIRGFQGGRIFAPILDTVIDQGWSVAA